MDAVTDKIGMKIEDFEFTATSDIQGRLSDLRGKYVILYFYPKDCTPGCTRESQDFRDLYNAFKSLNAVIYGVSLDSLKSHEKFKEEQNLPFDLIADKKGELCALFEVQKSPSLIGSLLGIERCTFLIDPNGHLAAQWRKVKVSGHVEEVLKKLSSLIKI